MARLLGVVALRPTANLVVVVVENQTGGGGGLRRAAAGGVEVEGVGGGRGLPQAGAIGEGAGEVFAKGVRAEVENYFKKERYGLSSISVNCRLEGSVNGVDGSFEIFSLSGKTEIIQHRFFQPDKTGKR